MEISLTPEMEKWVCENVESGLFDSPGQIIHEALRLLRERLEDPELKLTLLRRDIAIGLEAADRGEVVPGDQVFQELRDLTSEIAKRHR